MREGEECKLEGRKEKGGKLIGIGGRLGNCNGYFFHRIVKSEMIIRN